MSFQYGRIQFFDRTPNYDVSPLCGATENYFLTYPEIVQILTFEYWVSL